MSEDDDHPLSSEVVTRIESWVTEVEAQWRLLGIPVRMRRFFAADLTRDLEATAAAGVPVENMLDPDVARFARELAEANGVPLESAHDEPGSGQTDVGTFELIRTVLGGALIGAAFAWVVIYPLGLRVLENASDLASAITLDASAAIATVGGGLCSVCWRYRHSPSVNLKTLLRLAIGFSGGGLLSIAPTILLSRAWGYSSAPIVVLAEVAVVAAFCAVGITIALQPTPRLARTRLS